MKVTANSMSAEPILGCWENKDVENEETLNVHVTLFFIMRIATATRDQTWHAAPTRDAGTTGSRHRRESSDSLRETEFAHLLLYLKKNFMLRK